MNRPLGFAPVTHTPAGSPEPVSSNNPAPAHPAALCWRLISEFHSNDFGSLPLHKVSMVCYSKPHSYARVSTNEQRKESIDDQFASAVSYIDATISA
jgi:hypothetical protein